MYGNDQFCEDTRCPQTALCSDAWQVNADKSCGSVSADISCGRSFYEADTQKERCGQTTRGKKMNTI